MSKKLVLEILNEVYQDQVRANLGGIVGGKEAEEFARQDLAKYSKALTWVEKNL